MKKSVYQLWKESQEKGISSQEFRELLIKEGVIIKKCGCANCCNHDHKCNEDKSVLILSSGERIEDTKENQNKYQNEIRGGSVACSICGRAAIDNAMWLGF